jgi:hypothetical protein
MSYCRFENTAHDLADCLDNWKLDDDASDDEKRAKERIIKMAKEIVEMEE